MKRKISFLVVAVLAIFPIFRASATPESKPDPNFFIYLCIGQSNMEAGAVPAEQDKDFNNPRFQFMAAVDMPKLGREMGKQEQKSNFGIGKTIKIISTTSATG